MRLHEKRTVISQTNFFSNSFCVYSHVYQQKLVQKYQFWVYLFPHFLIILFQAFIPENNSNIIVMAFKRTETAVKYTAYILVEQNVGGSIAKKDLMRIMQQNIFKNSQHFYEDVTLCYVYIFLWSNGSTIALCRLMSYSCICGSVSNHSKCSIFCAFEPDVSNVFLS